MAFEMVKVGGVIEAFLSLHRFRFTSGENAKIIFTLGEESFEAQVRVHEGGMRLRLSDETTERLIQALQEGVKVAILVEDFEEVLDPEHFSTTFAQFIGSVP